MQLFVNEDGLRDSIHNRKEPTLCEQRILLNDGDVMTCDET